MVTDKRIISAINGIKNKKLRDVLARGFDSNIAYFSAKDFHDNIAEFRRLLPTYFDAFVEACPSITYGRYDDYITDCEELYGFLCLELGIVDLCDITTIKNFVGGGISVKRLAHCAPSVLYLKKALEKGAFTEKEVLAFAEAEPEYLSYILPLMTSSDSEVFSSALDGYLRSAKLQDSLRFDILRAMLTATDAVALLKYADEIDDNNYYRLRVMNDVAASVGDYTAVLPPKELVTVLRAAANREIEKCLAYDFRHAYHFIHAYDRVHPDRDFSDLAKRLIDGGTPRARQALFMSLKSDSVNGAYAKILFGRSISAEDLSFFIYNIRPDALDKSDMPVVFERLYAVLVQMDKVNYHYKTDADVTFARDLSKSEIVRVLAQIAALSDDMTYTERLDALYDTWREESQARYLEHNDKKTALDVRAAAIKFLKTDDYYAIKYYDGKNIKLVYDEAVKVSDYLKSKKQQVKTKLIKEFLRSGDKKRIAEYLCGCAEDYKRQAGEEMSVSVGKVSEKKLEKPAQRYSWNSESVFEVEMPSDEIGALAAKKFAFDPVRPMKVKRYTAFIAALDKFIKDNADHEYETSYFEGKVTFGSYFTTLKYDRLAVQRVGFKQYPLGAELKKLYEENLTEDEIACLSLLMHCSHNNNFELTYALLGKNADTEYMFEHMHGCDKTWRISSAYNIIRELYTPVVYELLSKQTLCRMLYMFADPACLKLMKRREKQYFTNIPRGYIAALGEADDRSFAELTLSVECAFVTVDASDCLSYAVLKRACEYGLISSELARYFMLKHGGFAYSYDVNNGKEYVLRSDYEFPKFKKALTEFLADALDAEFDRGSLQTPYSDLIRRTPTFGINNYMRAIVALRGITWVRSPDGCDKDDIFSKILKCNRADGTDNYELFAELVTKYGITRDELIRAALFNPVYVDHTAKYLDIPGLKLAVYWFVAHLNEALYGDEKDEREQKIKEFSDISYPDFQDGAFDCKWYEEMVASVPADELKRIYDNAKYVTVGGLHKRAQRFFDAVNGKIDKAECLEKINGTRNKDYCLIYSLIPVKDKTDLRERYEILSEFLRESKQFGSQRQLSERRTVDIAFENLARTAGYSDTNIFIFEMESDAPSDVYRPYVTDGITVTPYIDERAFKVAYNVNKDGKTLSSIPQKASKDKTIVELRDRIKALNKKFRRIVSSIEQCMVTRAAFDSEQLRSMCRERIIQTVLSKLLLLADGELCVYSDGKLRRIDGAEIRAAGEISVAHPVELKQKGLLEKAIEYIVKNNIKQPFKQALREIYSISEQEKEQDEVLRFKGFDVDLRKCVAALKGKGWGVSDDIGLRKVYYKTDTVAAIFRECDFLYVADYENVNRELHGIFFLKRKSGEIIPLKDVDGITFSETLRDVDLMITVSSNTVYDFELAMSTVEMRHAVLKSIVDILGLTNVSFLKDNIKVMGRFGTYVINIRTGLVFKEGKGNLLLDTVYSVDKPLLLDFVDEDPMTADIISKAIVLANDETVRDPAILHEIKY